MEQVSWNKKELFANLAALVYTVPSSFGYYKLLIVPSYLY